MLNLERLRTLHAVSTTGSVRGAAEALHVTTSAVSQQLSRLEREVGQQLLERQGRGIQLTDVGGLLAEHAARLLQQVELIETDLADHRGAVAGSLSVAAFATAARGLLPPMLHTLRQRHPSLTVRLAELEPTEAIAELRHGAVDIAVVQDWPEEPLPVPEGISRVSLLEDVLDVALPVQHHFAGRDVVTLDELRDEDWVSWPDDEICHGWLENTLRRNGIEPRVKHTASEHSTQLAVVAAGSTVAIIPRLGRGRTPAGVRFVPLRPAPRRRVFALWRNSTTNRPAFQAALRALQDSARQCDTDTPA
ncbi:MULTISPECIES: LysR family transcriptional regulator [Prauserella salsuginis group]|uniref:DNA-binding transcriptional LysR family regulator n=2 Tax=Prauserella salsuginis group TaxID=2893672 RepID=A0A839XQ28_9PSEU|nr:MULTISPECIES: LysR family transcriptional regulator [Prauserella salsuginis group]MBB3663594.1 DNA-binding transcriptional LysR family regulator [Prauserella sediminis]MCR3722624.1 DNA-binding transcriptional regulator, LysR family [Prauserella flava]MCR3737066.1 DNA-binding transcriptional regulator, LysR family [Prauserella salsuginis]